MTHTDEPMTLAQLSADIGQYDSGTVGTRRLRKWKAAIDAELAKQREAEPVAWRPMNTAPRDGTVIVLRFGEDGKSPGWFDSPAHPIKNDDGTWPDNPYGHPWAFIDKGSEIKHGEDVGAWFVNHARDTEYGPTHWRPYTHPQQRNADSVDRDAYEGARKDLLDWKCRAQRAEAELRLLGYTGIDASEPPAVASRDREDAERWRITRNNTGDGLRIITWDLTAPEKLQVMFPSPLLCDEHADAARRENKQ